MADEVFKSHRFTNTSAGPRGVHTSTGQVMLEPGESQSLDVSESELRSAEATGYFKMGGKAKAVETEAEAKA